MRSALGVYQKLPYVPFSSSQTYRRLQNAPNANAYVARGGVYPSCAYFPHAFLDFFQ